MARLKQAESNPAPFNDADIQPAIKRAKAEGLTVTLRHAGFEVRIPATGSVSFYSKRGAKREALGRYSNAASIKATWLEHCSRQDAKARHTDAGAAVRHKDRKADDAPLLRDAWAQYRDSALQAKDTAKHIDARVQRLVMKTDYATLKLSSMDEDAWGDLLDGIEARIEKDEAERARATKRKPKENPTANVMNSLMGNLGAFVKWAMEKRLISVNRLAPVRYQRATVSRDRVLEDDEIRSIWRAAENLGQPYGAGVRLLMLTALRRDEVFALEWSEVRDDRIRLPASRTKSSRAIDVPLTDAMRALLPSERSGQYVFSTDGGRTHFSGYSKAKRRLDSLMPGIAPWRLHDFRRTFATAMNEAGHEPHIIEAALNHAGVQTGVAGVYNRAGYFKQRQALMAAWVAHISRLCPPQA